MHKRLLEEYHGVTEKACVLFLASCEECHLRKAKKSVKSLVVKPISSTRFLSRCQVDLIDFRDMSETHNMADCGIPYKWLLVYQDHFTKYLILRPLKHKSAVEVADVVTARPIDVLAESRAEVVALNAIWERSASTAEIFL